MRSWSRFFLRGVTLSMWCVAVGVTKVRANAREVGRGGGHCRREVRGMGGEAGVGSVWRLGFRTWEPSA